MRQTLLLLAAVGIFAACNSKQNNKESNKKRTKAEYVMTYEGIGDLKVNMSDSAVSKLLNQQFNFEKTNEQAPHYWSDTIAAKYKNLPVSLIFERQAAEPNGDWLLMGIMTSSNLCSTANGYTVGDMKSDVIAGFDDNAIDVYPIWEQVNDSTWLPSKSNWVLQVRDSSATSQITFHLKDKKVTALEAGVMMGD